MSNHSEDLERQEESASRFLLPEIIEYLAAHECTDVFHVPFEFIIPLSFLPLLAIPRFGAAPVFILTSILSACIDLPFAMMQRFNRPRLRQLARKEKCL